MIVLAMDEQRIKNLIKGWYENKARMESDPTFRFLCLWICFNAWLDYRSEGNNDGEMIGWLTEQTPESSDLIGEYEHAKQTEPFNNLLKSFAAMAPIHDSRGRRDPVEIDNENNRGNIIRGIYRVRCNLFHGGKEADNPRDQKLVMVCTEILNKWVGNLVNSWEHK